MGTISQSEEHRYVSHRLSAGLDLARAVAACYVVLHHVADRHGWSQGLGSVFRFGQEAVIVFFLLSGFVIFLNEHSKAVYLRGYYLRRFRRIYPALIVAVLVSTLVAIDNQTFAELFRWRELFGTLLSLQDVSLLKPGVIVDPYLGNDPLWSLSYEVLFYLVFPFVLRLWLHRPSRANHAVGAACCAAYLIFVVIPNHCALVTAYFLIWWCGAMVAEAYLRGERDFRSVGTPFYWLLLLCAFAGVVVLVLGYRGLGLYPFLPFRHFIVAAVMLMALFGPLGGSLASISITLSRPAGAIASISYGLYVLHYPLLVDWRRAQTVWGALAALVLLLVTAYVADRRLGRLLPRVTAR